MTVEYMLNLMNGHLIITLTRGVVSVFQKLYILYTFILNSVHEEVDSNHNEVSTFS